MKRFHFSLRPLSVLRAYHEQRAREAFAVTVHAYVRSEEDLARVRARVAEFERAVTAGRRERFNPSVEAQNFAGYRRECASEAESGGRVLAARETMDRSRGAYIEAHQKLEVVRRLEEKARAAHRLALAREEQAEFDDFAGRRHFAEPAPFHS